MESGDFNSVSAVGLVREGMVYAYGNIYIQQKWGKRDNIINFYELFFEYLDFLKLGDELL